MGAFHDLEVHGVVAARELLAAGVGRRAIQHAVKTGRLWRKYRGVYAVGRPDLSPWGERRAIVLACGPGAVLSHRSAAGAWGIRPDGGTTWDVTIATSSPRAPRAPVRIHRSPLPADEVTAVQGIPLTTVPRTLLDLAAVVPPHHLRRAAERAEQHELLDHRALLSVVAAHPRRPGTPALRALVADLEAHGVATTRSDVEAAFLQVCLDHGLPRPQVNRYDNGREADFRWPRHRLVVEVDGWRYHRTRRSFEQDRARDRDALQAGWRTARFTATEVLRTPQRVAADLRALLLPPRP